MKIRSRPSTATVSLLAMCVLAACGSQGLSKAQLVSQGDEICKEAAEELGPLFAKLFPTGNETPPASEAAPTMKEAAELVREETDSLSRLEPQDDLQDEYDQIVKGLDEGADLVDESAKLASEGNTNGYLEKLQEANRVDQDTRDKMVKFGFKDCGGATEG